MLHSPLLTTAALLSPPSPQQNVFQRVAADPGVREALEAARARQVVATVDGAEAMPAERMLWDRMEDCDEFRELAFRMLDVVEAAE